MSTRYHRDGPGAYECHSRKDQQATSTCRSISAHTVDDAVTQRLLAALNPEELVLAFAAAAELTGRRDRASRAAELAVERARYDADRAERAFHAAEPENRLVVRSLEARWETKLAALVEAESAMAQARAAIPPLPARPELQALLTDVPGLWSASSTTARDRKRLLRTLIADITLLPEPGPDKLAIGIRWHTGATDEVITERPLPPGPAKRTPSAATEMIIRLGPDRTNEQLVIELTAAGLRTGHGNLFDAKAVQWVRHVHHVKTPSPYAAGEISVRAAADRLAVSVNVVYYWIDTGQLSTHRGTGHQHRIPWTPAIEAACRQRITNSTHLAPQPQTLTAGEAV